MITRREGRERRSGFNDNPECRTHHHSFIVEGHRQPTRRHSVARTTRARFALRTESDSHGHSQSGRFLAATRSTTADFRVIHTHTQTVAGCGVPSQPPTASTDHTRQRPRAPSRRTLCPSGTADTGCCQPRSERVGPAATPRERGAHAAAVYARAPHDRALKRATVRRILRISAELSVDTSVVVFTWPSFSKSQWLILK